VTNWRETGEMPDPAEVDPAAINTATGRPHSDDAELYAARDAFLARTGRT
jgi:hypothetical protein